MPNWCENELTVSGEAEELKKFVMDSQGLPAKYPPVYRADGSILSDPSKYTEPRFCFNAQVPTPKEILAVGFDGRNGVPDADGNFPVTGYRWNLSNWGTKWDVYRDAITPKDMGWYEGAESICFGFDTAWSPPQAWLEAVVEKYPALSFRLHYEERGCFFAGDFYGENGSCWDDPYTDEQCDALFEEDDD